MPREAAVVDAVQAELTRRGAWWINVHGTATGRNGIPDIIAIHLGYGLAVECKAPRGRTRKLQAWELERVACAGGRAIVARSVEDVRAVLDEIEAEDRAREGAA